jgi:hypothetical protein
MENDPRQVINNILIQRDKDIEKVKLDAWRKIQDIRLNCEHDFTDWTIIKIEHRHNINFEEYLERTCLLCDHKELKIDLT